MRDREAQRRAENQRRVIAVKRLLSCVDCGWRPRDDFDTANLELDHRDPATKHAGRRRAAIDVSWSWDRISRELSLCVPRCRTCHAKRTARQRAGRDPYPLAYDQRALPFPVPDPPVSKGLHP